MLDRSICSNRSDQDFVLETGAIGYRRGRVGGNNQNVGYRFDFINGPDFLPLRFYDFAHLFHEVLAFLRGAAEDDYLLNRAGVCNGFHLEGRLPAGSDHAQRFRVRRREIFRGNPGGGARSQAAEIAHVDDGLNLAAAPIVKSDSIGGSGIGAQANEVPARLPSSHDVELLLASLEAAPRHAADFSGAAVAKHFFNDLQR